MKHVPGKLVGLAGPSAEEVNIRQDRNLSPF